MSNDTSKTLENSINFTVLSLSYPQYGDNTYFVLS